MDNQGENMDFMDIESFRSKYSDITVTAVPTNAGNPCQESVNTADDVVPAKKPRVEITRISVGNPGAAASSSTVKNTAALAYVNEYKQVMAKLEYTKRLQAQLQLMAISNRGSGIGVAPESNHHYGLLPSAITVDPNSNIVDKYSDLLAILSGISPNINPTGIGLRAPKERLFRDIAHARVVVRECMLLLERDLRKASPTTTE